MSDGANTGYGGIVSPLPFPGERRVIRPLRTEAGDRNGLPAFRPYVRRDDSAREAEVQAFVAEAKRRGVAARARKDAAALARIAARRDSRPAGETP
jgi:hypothetical protein